MDGRQKEAGGGRERTSLAHATVRGLALTRSDRELFLQRCGLGCSHLQLDQQRLRRRLLHAQLGLDARLLSKGGVELRADRVDLALPCRL